MAEGEMTINTKVNLADILASEALRELVRKLIREELAALEKTRGWQPVKPWPPVERK